MAGMDTRRRVGIGALVAGLLLLVAGWWLWGGVETPEVEAPRRGVGRVAMRPTEPPPYLRRDNEGPPQLEDVLDDRESVPSPESGGFGSWLRTRRTDR